MNAPDIKTVQQNTTDMESEEPKYVAMARSMAEAAANLNPTQRLILMREFLDDVEVAAINGEIKGSDGAVHPPDFINDRIALASRELNKREDKREYREPLTLVPRAHGLRFALDTLLRDENTATYLDQAMRERSESSVSPEKSSQVIAVDALADQAIEDSGIELPDNFKDPEEDSKAEDIQAVQSEINQLLMGVSPEDQRLLHRYAVGLLADKEHEYGDALKRMPDSLLKSGIHSQYVGLYKKLREILDLN